MRVEMANLTIFLKLAWKLLRNTQRYGEKNNNVWPDIIIVLGTFEQAEFVAKCLSNYEAGCDYYWYVDKQEE